jgi:hypothetical protein
VQQGEWFLTFWANAVPSKRREPLVQRHSFISHITWIFKIVLISLYVVFTPTLSAPLLYAIPSFTVIRFGHRTY